VSAPAADAPAWMAALLGIARELWVLTDRQRVLEVLLAERGIVAADAVSNHQPDPALQAQLDADCRAYMQRLVADLSS
jgi:hypothetical protein